jgi:hypothetical protein
LDLDTLPNGTHPFGAHNYCVNASLQAFGATLAPVGHNIRLSENTWDPQLNSMKPSGIHRFRGFIGDYFGIDTTSSKVFTTSVSTFNGGNNSGHFQQQVVASLNIP